MRAIVVEVQGDEASVQALGGGCGHCSSEGGCGSGTLSKLFCSSEPRLFKVRNDASAKVGDEVQVSLPDGVLLRGTMKLYMLPLLLLMVGGIAGRGVANDVVLRDTYAAAGAVIGLLLGFVLAKLLPSVSGRAVVSSIVLPRSGT
ncbi:MAG: SoxR reducing system RseC family protein [Sideroxydans sp.]|nr:SoxR reducing system RseC family protein [Sideroxydans sp.]